MSGLEVQLSQAAPIPLDATLSCPPGEVLAIVGPSGSGKSSILRAIAGILRPGAGAVRVNGQTWFDSDAGVDLPTHQRSVGVVFQSYALFPHKSALGNLMAAMGHLPAERRASRAMELMELMHLAGLEQRRPAELSGGQQQRVALARALARDPSVLLLDEPFSAVDKSTRQRLYREIAQLRNVLNMPVVLVTHDLDEARMLADRMSVLHLGRTLQAGTPEEVTNRPDSPAVARLVEVRNLFPARVGAHEHANGKTMVDWSGLMLETRLRPELPAGSLVSLAVPDGFVVLHRRDRPSRGEHENPVSGEIDLLLELGQVAQVTLRPRHDPEWPLHFSVPLHVARRNGLAEGVEATVSLLADGIHLMTGPLPHAKLRRP